MIVQAGFVRFALHREGFMNITIITKILLLFVGGIITYLISGANPAIVISLLVYKKDIREFGSGNPGFTNFTRAFGMKWGIVVLLLDLFKAAVCIAAVSCAYCFAAHGDFRFAAAVTGCAALLGHAFPVWYGFVGGKGFLVYMSTIWFVDWRAGLAATLVLLVLIFTVKYMSLSTMACILASLVVLAVTKCDVVVFILMSLQVAFIILRHRENIVRLAKGTERKFNFKKST